MRKEELEEILAYIRDQSKVRLVVVNYSSLINLDVQHGDDFVCKSVTGNCTVNIINAKDGDSGIIELIIDTTGGYTITLGSMFTKQLGDTTVSTTAGDDNFISWTKIGTDIVYSVSVVAT